MRRADLPWIITGAVVSALFWIDPIFFPLALLGPIVSGVALAVRGLGLRPLVVLWVTAGLLAVVSDFMVNQEDVVFHLVLTVVMVGLAAGSWWLARLLFRRRTARAARR